jgi:hypothetical protein
MMTPTTTPWGPIQRLREIAPGVFEVFPKGAMGPHLMLTETAAEERLSGAARNRAIQFENYYCFGSESGGVWAIAAWELTDLQPALFEGARCILEQGVDVYLLKRLEQFQQDYLKEVGLG